MGGRNKGGDEDKCDNENLEVTIPNHILSISWATGLLSATAFVLIYHPLSILQPFFFFLFKFSTWILFIHIYSWWIICDMYKWMWLLLLSICKCSSVTVCMLSCLSFSFCLYLVIWILCCFKRRVVRGLGVPFF